MSHSPEPWEYHPCLIGHESNRYNPIVKSLAGEGHYIARLFSEKAMTGLASNAPPHEEADANAYRIVACVNACAGIPTDELPRIGKYVVLQFIHRLSLIAVNEVKLHEVLGITEDAMQNCLDNFLSTHH